MKPIFSRRSRRRTQKSSDGAFFKKDTSPGFFGEGEHESFFSPAVTVEQPGIQRKCAECEKVDKKVQREPGKKEEDKVMRAEDKKEEDKIQREPEKKEDEKLQRAEEKKEEDKIVQKKESNTGTSSSKGVSNYVSSLNGKGQSLSPVANQFFSFRMGYDFSNVKIHTDKDAAASAKAINAKAYTTGKDVVFNEGQFDTGTTKGKKLLAHELTHVMQQDKSNAEAVDRKINYEEPTESSYVQTDPVTTVLNNPNLALTTPLINGSPIPKDTQKAGELIFKAFDKGINLNKTNTGCRVAEPDVKVSATIAIIKKPTGDVWQGSAEGQKFASRSKACEDKGTTAVTVYIKGKGGKKAIDVYNKIEANEKEHYNDLKTSSETHLKGIIDHINTFGTKTVSGSEADASKKCIELYTKHMGTKDKDAIIAFVDELKKQIADRDKKTGSHHFTPDVTIDGKDCFNVVVKI
jgi:hypothetical protein